MPNAASWCPLTHFRFAGIIPSAPRVERKHDDYGDDDADDEDQNEGDAHAAAAAL